MIELVNTLLPDLPKSLEWVYGVCYIIATISFFILFISPTLMIFSLPKRKRR